MLWNWMQGEKTPFLEMLLRVCKLLNIPLATFLSQKDTVPVSLKLSSNKKKATSLPSSCQYRRFNKKLAQKILEEALGEFPPPSLKEISKRTGGDLAYISQHFPQLYSEVKAKIKEYQRNSYLQEMEQALLKVLDANEFPSPPMIEVAQRLDYAESTMRRNFPALCAKISAKYFEDQEIVREQIRRETCRRIHEIVYDLHQKGEHPGENKVGKILGDLAFSLTPIYWQAWKDALRELEL
jgi:transcriptional regulator with XRE-family HTH domain